MRQLRSHPYGRTLLAALVLGTALPAAAQTATPAPGSWATYEWRESAQVEVPVVVQQPEAGGAVTWSIDRQTAPPPIFVTYSVLRGDEKSYVLQVVTRGSADGKPLSITQVTVDRASGKALKSVTRDKKGLIATPEKTFRPLREAGVRGAREEVTVPAGRFTAVKSPYQNGTVWVSDQVPALGIVRGTFPNGQMELIKSGTTGAEDLLRS